jgi:hypothetical protein
MLGHDVHQLTLLVQQRQARHRLALCTCHNVMRTAVQMMNGNNSGNAGRHTHNPKGGGMKQRNKRAARTCMMETASCSDASILHVQTLMEM